MNFRIADTFTASLTRLTGDEQKASKTTAFDLQMQPAGGGMSFHKLDRAKDKNFWSVRVSSDLRLIVHKSEGSLLLCYVHHHDAAYAWAERRKLVTHPSTGAAQWVQIRETVQDVLVPVFVSAQQKENSPRAVANKLLFAGRTDEELLGFGVPQEWLEDVKQANEDTLLTLAEHLPAEAAEALLELATGGKPRAVKPAAILLSPFDHPDAQRRFRVMRNIDELQAALEYPWEKWTVFLHPEQRQWVERDYNGPARVSGSAGTGKTIVALHRAAYLARTHPDARVLLCSYSETLAHALRAKLGRLLTREPRLGLSFRLLDRYVETVDGVVAIGTMHLAKGLEFRAVAVMACDDEVIPSQERIEAVGDEADLQEVYDTERHLLYVACTRARDNLLVTSGGDKSEFLADLIG